MSLRGKKIAFSGVLSIPRGKAQDLAQKAGATVCNVVNSQTDILVASISSGLSKVSQAQDLGVVIWDEDAFIDALSSDATEVTPKVLDKEQRLIEHLKSLELGTSTDELKLPKRYFESTDTSLIQELKKTQAQFLQLLDQRKLLFAEERQRRSLQALGKLSSKQPNRKSKKNKKDTKALKQEVQTRLKDADRFYRACVGGRLVLVRAFLQNGGDVNVELEREDGSTSFGLIEAVRHGHLEVAAKILSSGADTTVRVGNDKETALHLAVRGRDARMVQLLLRVQCEMVNTVGTGRTPLLSLAAHCVCGVYENASAGEGESEHLKLAKTQARMAELLLSEGKAEAECKDGKGRTPFCYAAERQNGPLMAVLGLWRKSNQGNSCRFCRQCCGSGV